LEPVQALVLELGRVLVLEPEPVQALVQELEPVQALESVPHRPPPDCQPALSA
jgi:hypothetical protein